MIRGVILTSVRQHSYGNACLTLCEQRSSPDPNCECTLYGPRRRAVESRIPDLPLIARGKVRDIYSVDDGHLLIVTTDRLSAYDVVMPDPVPMKGYVLTQI